ncbi:restriction endonuclease [Herbaspirillum seropedicae]|uniref:restriction endonuclease n=1 Tax=Herbaspirillum seropedicae TaxID=964 RepID=UPI00285705D9|nr:restriction endonuclease [Herbaspirillum seropedicae]MDR6396579.1 Holliday junction resolvase [Herbaspirillum seropedicae]
MQKNDVAPPDLPRLIQDVLADLGYDVDASTVAEKVRRLDIGLPAEDEFSAVCSWLGKCELIHKLDQHQVPISSKTKYQVPDLLAKFSTQSNKSPLLIEVKSKKDKQLSFTPEYISSLQNYADLVNMPLLIAWKYHSLWILFEAKHMKKAVKNFNITLDAAMKENLLGVLAGDVAYRIGVGAGIHLSFRKDKLLNTEQNEDGKTEQWMTVIDDVSFTDREGTRRIDVSSDTQALITTWDLDEVEDHTPSHMHLHFVARDNGIQFAHHALVRLLNWEAPNTARPHWRGLLRKENITKNVASFSSALEMAFTEKFVSHVFHFLPHEIPEFVPPIRLQKLPMNHPKA